MDPGFQLEVRVDNEVIRANGYVHFLQVNLSSSDSSSTALRNPDVNIAIEETYFVILKNKTTDLLGQRRDSINVEPGLLRSHGDHGARAGLRSRSTRTGSLSSSCLLCRFLGSDPGGSGCRL